MAELAAGAVSSLLSIIRDEARRLDRVAGDVHFIREEMESMNSFLLHLARTSPHGGEHDEQVRTWMNQVRVLAHDCNNCIDLYLYRGNPEIQRARRGLLWWFPWFLHKMVAQHRAATQLHELKNRARDVGERRLRYGVEVPGKIKAAAGLGQSPDPAGLAVAAASSSYYSHSHSTAADGEAAGDDDEDDGDNQAVAGDPRRRALLRSPALENYFQRKLKKWIIEVLEPTTTSTAPTVAVVVADTEDANDVARQALDLALTNFDEDNVKWFAENNVKWFVDISEAAELYGRPVLPSEVLCYILRLIADSKSRQEDEGKEAKQQQDSYRQAYVEKMKLAKEIRKNIKDMKVDDKIEKLKNKITSEQKVDKLDLDGQSSTEPLGLLLQALPGTGEKEASSKLASEDIEKIAQKLQEYMENEELVQADATVTEADNEKTPKEPVQACAAVTEAGTEKTPEEPVQAGAAATEAGTEKTPEEPIQAERAVTEAGIEKTPEEPIQAGAAVTEAGIEKVSEESVQVDAAVTEAGTEKAPTKAPLKPNPIHLQPVQYVHILKDVFLTSNTLQAKQQDRSATQAAMTNTTNPPAAASTSTTTTLREDQIKEMVQKFAHDIAHELLEYTVKKLSKGKWDQDLTPDAIEETREKVKDMQWRIKRQLFIKGILDKIDRDLGDRRTLIIIKDDKNYLHKWEEARNALSLLNKVAGIVMVTSDHHKEHSRSQGGKEYSYPQWEPITYSLGGLCHDRVLDLTSQDMNEDCTDKSKIIHDILQMCEPHEFSKEIFAHALVANPKRTLEELQKLRIALVPQKSLGSNAKKMFRFSYRDLPKEFKSCLLYLAIFPRGHTIRKSTLVGRWVVEGLITKEDWPSSVHRAEQCIAALIDRWLVHPVDVVGASVKSCMVDDPVHEFITNIAKKQRILEPRLSQHLARHFSIFNDVRLRRSDRIDNFLEKPSESSQWSLIKVLDLEGCRCFENNQCFLKDIYRKMLLLKYLSLRGTDVTQLHTEINKLHELEVLDIRETEVPPSATKHVLLLKLKRLLAGHTKINRAEEPRAVRIPDKIEKMLNMEVLSNVEASSTGKELRDIGKLSQLRKLGVVIKDTDNHLRYLFEAIVNVHHCLRSLSITLPTDTTTTTSTSTSEGIPTRSNGDLPKDLEILSIKGTTGKVHILPLLAKDPIPNQLTKVTLSSTSLDQGDLEVLSKHPTLQCVRLRNVAYTAEILTITKDQFQNLIYFLVEGSNMTSIKFDEGAASKLEKIILSFTNIKSLCGVEYLPELEELELNQNNSELLSSIANAQQIAKVILRDSIKQGDVQRLAKKPNLRCLVLVGNFCNENKLTFNKDEFQKLDLLSVDCPSITNISFTYGSAPKLKKIVWSFTKMESLLGIDFLPKLKELELNGDLVPNQVKEAIKEHQNNLVFNFKHNKPEHQDQEIRNAPERGHGGGCTSFWKNRH